jgi:predicted outer membrane lipoprotein
MATPTPAVTVSPVDAARAAWQHTRSQLFPIRLERWLVLGLLAFLDQCGRAFRGGGGSSGGGGNGHGTGGGFPPDFSEIGAWLQRASEWLAAHATLIALGAVAGILVFGLVAAVVLWVNARGVFMYADAVATGRAEVSRPWRQHAEAAASYFSWSLGITLAMVFTVLFAAGLVVATVFAFVGGRLQGTGGWLMLAAMVPVLLLLALAFPLLALAGVALRDFVAPLQLATGLPCGAAARLLESLVVAQPGVFVLYLLLKALVVVGTGLVVVIGGCLTCCLGFLPIVLQTAFQPLFHFERGLSLMLLRQMGYDVAGRLAS